MFRFIDLFAGVGGMTEGFRGAVAPDGKRLFEPTLLVDWNAPARETHLRNYPKTRYLFTNIANLSPKDLLNAAQIKTADLDALIGGPPCQGFSRLNKSTRRMLEDPRNGLYRKFLELTRDLQPKMVLIENVPNLLDFDGGKYRDETYQFLAESGYEIKSDVLSANEYGVPQLRKRAFVVGLRRDLGLHEFGFPKGNFAPLRTAREVNAAIHGKEDVFFSLPFISVEDAIGDLPVLNPGQDVIAYSDSPHSDYQAARRKGARILTNHSAREHDKEFVEKKLKKIPEGGSNQDLDGRSRFDRGREIKYLSQAYGRLHRHGIAQTITANFSNPGSGRFIHYREHRSITVREAARFQSFDDTFIFCGQRQEQQRQVGNAVPPLLARALAEHFGKLLLNVEHGLTAKLEVVA
jgi:DNA (cytosine-5)-methyltransferase 1